MTNFKVGQKIRMKEDCMPAKNGDILTLSISNGTLWAVDDSGNKMCACNSDRVWQLLSKDISDISTYEVGDVLVGKNDSKNEVMEILTQTVLLKSFRNGSYFWENPYILKRLGTHFKDQPEEKPIEEMTLKEVCKELGREVKIIK